MLLEPSFGRLDPEIVQAETHEALGRPWGRAWQRIGCQQRDISVESCSRQFLLHRV